MSYLAVSKVTLDGGEGYNATSAGKIPLGRPEVMPKFETHLYMYVSAY